jgi:RHS repeat-associated protein
VVGSVRALTDQTGAVVLRHDYLPFGEDSQSMFGDPMRFAGKHLDPETALHYFEARYYRQTWGRFSQVDPLHVGAALTDPQQWNRYAYARNNPLAWGDPSGRNIDPIRLEEMPTFGAGVQECAFGGIHPYCDGPYDWWDEWQLRVGRGGRSEAGEDQCCPESPIETEGGFQGPVDNPNPDPSPNPDPDPNPNRDSSGSTSTTETVVRTLECASQFGNAWSLQSLAGRWGDNVVGDLALGNDVATIVTLGTSLVRKAWGDAAGSAMWALAPKLISPAARAVGEVKTNRPYGDIYRRSFRDADGDVSSIGRRATVAEVAFGVTGGAIFRGLSWLKAAYDVSTFAAGVVVCTR